jgi:hypothetical protein
LSFVLWGAIGSPWTAARPAGHDEAVGETTRFNQRATPSRTALCAKWVSMLAAMPPDVRGHMPFRMWRSQARQGSWRSPMGGPTARAPRVGPSPHELPTSPPGLRPCPRERVTDTSVTVSAIARGGILVLAASVDGACATYGPKSEEKTARISEPLGDCKGMAMTATPSAMTGLGRRPVQHAAHETGLTRPGPRPRAWHREPVHALAFSVSP